MKNTIVAVAAMLLLIPGPGISQEDYVTGFWLRDHCSEKRDTNHSRVNWTECVFYLNGLIDGYHLIRNMHTTEGTPVYDKSAGMCIQFPKAMTTGQVTETVVRYLDKYPEQLLEPATMAAYNAFSDTFSCYDNADSNQERAHRPGALTAH